MAPQRIIAAPRRRTTTAVSLGLATTLILLAGCDNLAFRRLDFDDTEAAKITNIQVRGGSGDVVVRGTGPDTEVRIKRVVRYQGGEPKARYEIKDSELILDSDCGNRCSVSYEVTAPPGVIVEGEGGSGNVDLSQVGAVKLRWGSGEVRVAGISGAVDVETGSGNIELSEASTSVRLRAGSGNVNARRISGATDAEAGSGNVTIELETQVSARVHTSSGNATLLVPSGSYRVRTSTGSGETEVTVVNDPNSSVVLDGSTGSGNVMISQR
ncbi:DUF4097 family beta strand repeat-containing protein [Micromonospora profundi]|uniref:DUF4097 family beta strand repeat-containing protein n=1 Tax=Micromonospora profundi TaxID=1420889 RepID=UPI00381A6D03